MTHDPDQHASLKAMYSDYFLDYASYVILERAVPHLFNYRFKRLSRFIYEQV